MGSYDQTPILKQFIEEKIGEQKIVLGIDTRGTSRKDLQAKNFRFKIVPHRGYVISKEFRELIREYLPDANSETKNIFLNFNDIKLVVEKMKLFDILEMATIDQSPEALVKQIYPDEANVCKTF